MRRFFDTSVLVASALAQHPHHPSSVAAYARSSKSDSFCYAHSVAEIYATLTRLPASQRLSCDQAVVFLRDLRARLTLVSLDEDDYFNTVLSLAGSNIAGGIVYDALLARCALKSEAEVIYTWNVTDFRRLGPEIARRVRTP